MPSARFTLKGRTISWSRSALSAAGAPSGGFGDTNCFPRLLKAALEKVKAQFSAKQFQIFDFIVLKQWSPSEVAKSLGASVTSVYLAKHRVSAAVRKEMVRLERQMANGVDSLKR